MGNAPTAKANGPYGLGVTEVSRFFWGWEGAGCLVAAPGVRSAQTGRFAVPFVSFLAPRIVCPIPERVGQMFSYKFPLEQKGHHTLLLKFAETEPTAPDTKVWQCRRPCGMPSLFHSH